MITDKGEKPIEEIQVGDKVLSQNVETGEKGYKEVKQLFVHEVDTLYHVQIKGITISNTEEHPYWVEAKDLQVGDQVLLASGEKAAIENVTKEKLETPVKVYNFEVADWHTYFVADIGVLVHNVCTAKAKTLAQNREKGRAFEQEQLLEFQETAINIVEQVTIKTTQGTKIRVDAIGIDKTTGKIVIQEYKSSVTAQLTTNQTKGFPELQSGGGIVVGRGKGIFKGNTLIPPTKVELIRPY